MDSTSRRLREADQKIRILYEIGRLVSSLLDVQLVLDAIVNLLVEEFKLDACSIRLLDPDGKLKIESQRGLREGVTGKEKTRPNIESYSEDCFLTGRIVIVDDTEKTGTALPMNRVPGGDIKSFAVTPIKVEGKTIGVLVTCSRKKHYFHERFNDVIYVISDQIGVAIRISQLYEEIYSLNQSLEEKVRERTAELEEKNIQLIQAERQAAIGEMAKRIAHELRNSLIVVGGFSRRLYEKSDKDGPNGQYLKVIFEEVKTLEEKVSNLIKLGTEG
ncbi:MAG: GAF domain-containing protein [Deltaproteobacteria bacterium]|nr:GAF domain-containing protein [Deltaproteobacteria bacterium]